jgi:uncharacterized protein YqhQ
MACGADVLNNAAKKRSVLNKMCGLCFIYFVNVQIFVFRFCNKMFSF